MLILGGVLVFMGEWKCSNKKRFCPGGPKQKYSDLELRIHHGSPGSPKKVSGLVPAKNYITSDTSPNKCSTNSPLLVSPPGKTLIYPHLCVHIYLYYDVLFIDFLLIYHLSIYLFIYPFSCLFTCGLGTTSNQDIPSKSPKPHYPA